MTTIAYRNGIMAADTRAWSGDRSPVGMKHKISWSPEDNSLVAVSSSGVGIPAAVTEWWLAGMPDGAGGLKKILAMTDEPGFSLLAVDVDGSAYIMNGHGLKSQISAEFYSVGSGEDYALGAMKMGATAEEAVRIACYFDPYSEPPIQTMGHDGSVRVDSD